MNRERVGNVLYTAPEAFRRAMLIDRVFVLSGIEQEFRYYICPRCDISMDKMFAPFCSNCGQALDWSRHSFARRISPGESEY